MSKNSQYKHGHRGSKYTSPTWLSWRAMNERCHTTGAADYPRYGGRGIKVCERWRHSFENFLEDMGARPEGMTLDRIDVNGDYERANCRWAPMKEQGRNKRNHVTITFDGKAQCLAAWAEETGLSRHTIQWRIKKGWPLERVLSAEPMPREERGILGLKARGVIHADE